MSLDLVERYAVDKTARIFDVGGGSSRLVDFLLATGYEHLGVLDIAAPALELARARLGERAPSVEGIVGDVTTYEPSHPWDVWHDRAVFHFLVDADDRNSYVQAVRRSLAPSGVAVLATFGPQGPKKCSGLEVQRHSPETLAEVFGSDFALQEKHLEVHHTPGSSEQQFVYCVFRHIA